MIIQKLLRKINPIIYWRKKGSIIGKNCEIYNDVEFGSEPYLIEIGDFVRINSGVNLITHDGGVWVLRHMNNSLKNVDIFGKIKIGNNVHIGTNAIIMPGITVGNNVIIGCGSIVTKSIPDNCVVAGVPAKIIEDLNIYQSKNSSFFINTKNLSAKDKKIFLLANLNNEHFKGRK